MMLATYYMHMSISLAALNSSRIAVHNLPIITSEYEVIIHNIGEELKDGKEDNVQSDNTNVCLLTSIMRLHVLNNIWTTVAAMTNINQKFLTIFRNFVPVNSALFPERSG